MIPKMIPRWYKDEYKESLLKMNIKMNIKNDTKMNIWWLKMILELKKEYLYDWNVKFKGACEKDAEN